MVFSLSLPSTSLRSNCIGPQGAKALADALKINRTLASLRYMLHTAPWRGTRKPSSQVPPMEWMVAMRHQLPPSGYQRITYPKQVSMFQLLPGHCACAYGLSRG